VRGALPNSPSLARCRLRTIVIEPEQGFLPNPLKKVKFVFEGSGKNSQEGKEAMQERGPSRTAIVTAALRAAHYLLDAEPKILDDKFARAYAGFASDDELLKAINSASIPDFVRMRTLFALRNRYAEDELGRAIEHGTSQYIILGAGLDSFAYRRPDLLHSLDVYEVDHPASQAWKRARIQELGIKQPARLHYVPIDFEQETLTAGLTAGGINFNAPMFFSWLGVTQYLFPATVLDTLREIAELAAAGSEIAFQFVVPPATLAGDERALVTELAARAAAIGEPWLSFFEPEELEAHLKRIGFGKVLHFGPQQATERYLLGRSDGLSLPAYFRMITAGIE
jgi:methyltransferase (TIGR00027 family)